MRVALITFLWVCSLPDAHFAAAGPERSGYNTKQPLVNLVVNQAVQLQQLETRLEQQATQLQQQTTQLQQQTTQLQQQTTQLGDQSDELRSLRYKVGAIETSQDGNTAKLKTLSKGDAFLTQVNKPVIANAPILFGLKFSRGEGRYNPHTGVYTVATPGVYLLGFQMYPKFAQTYFYDMYISGSILTRSRCYNTQTYFACAASSVFHLKKGDSVWVQSDMGGEYWGAFHSYFFGALISPDP